MIALCSIKRKEKGTSGGSAGATTIDRPSTDEVQRIQTCGIRHCFKPFFGSIVVSKSHHPSSITDLQARRDLFTARCCTFQWRLLQSPESTIETITKNLISFYCWLSFHIPIVVSVAIKQKMVPRRCQADMREPSSMRGISGECSYIRSFFSQSLWCCGTLLFRAPQKQVLSSKGKGPVNSFVTEPLFSNAPSTTSLPGIV
jgi:hypothetical protein